MKKKILISILIITLLCSVFVLSGCKSETQLSIEKIEISVNKSVVFKVEDIFDTANLTVTATMSDDSTKTITNNLIWDKSQLKLDKDGKFTESGDFVVKVSFLKYENISLTITVKK